MKFKINLLMMSFFLLVELNAQVDYLKCNNFKISDSNIVSGSLNPILIGGQAFGGMIVGSGLALLFHGSHPIYFAAAWLAGSSLGVFLVGNIGDQYSSYWGTLLGGVAGSTIFFATNNDSKVYRGFFTALLIAIPCEIVSYYIFKTDNKNAASYLSNSNKFIESTFSNKTQTNPDISITLISISF
ncbi:MAG: hypothetical protein KGZ85_06495 [Ignavibacterium sp.]|nr:hypothetical protein [Ignavibacterium sp.]